MTDLDRDDLPDGWELLYFGSLTAQNGSGDPDNDLLTNLKEYQDGTDPGVLTDADGDGLADGWELLHFGSVTGQNDKDDPDNDLSNNLKEYQNGTNPNVIEDSDTDGLADGWELLHFQSLTAQSDVGDPDGDGYNNLKEYQYGTSPNAVTDADQDNLPDEWEMDKFAKLDYSPSDDPDNDLLTNLLEYEKLADPADADSDSDGMIDGWEIEHGLNSGMFADAAGDINGDGISNLQEFKNESLAVNVIIGGGNDASWDIKANGHRVVSCRSGMAASETIYILLGTKVKFTLHWVDTGQLAPDEYVLNFELTELPGADIPWIELAGNSPLAGQLARPMDTDQLKWEYVVPKNETVKIVAGGGGNTDTGPGNSPLNRAVARVGAAVSMIVITTPESPMPPDYRGAELIEWTILPANENDIDSDGDGIADKVDESPLSISDVFSDLTTKGKITTRAGRTFQIFDAENLEVGVRIIVGSGAASAVIETVDSSPRETITIPAGTGADFFLTTGSTTIELLRGSLEIVAQGVDTTVSATMTGPSVLSFDLVDAQTLKVASSVTSKSSVEISVDGGAPITLTRGESLPIAFTSDIDGDGVLDGTDACPNSDMSPTVVIGGYDSKVPNKVLSSGCTIMDRIALLAAEAKNHGQFESSAAQLANDLRKQGIITNKESAAIKSSAAKSDIGKK